MRDRAFIAQSIEFQFGDIDIACWFYEFDDDKCVKHSRYKNLM